MPTRVLLTALLTLACVASLPASESDGQSKKPAAAPLVLWSFDGEAPLVSEGELTLELTPRGGAKLGVAGPRPSEYPDFRADNQAVQFPQGRNYLEVADPGAGSPLDFENGDSITLECWVQWSDPLRGTYVYLIGKGRTHSGPGTTENHNYALRLANTSSGVYPSFLFADRETVKSKGGDPWHRWTAKTGIPEDGAWHHVAVTYTFGKPDSIRGYVDGDPVKGVWDAGGATTKPPVVDDDALWIGSSMGGQSTFSGAIDNVAIHRRALSDQEVRAKVRINLDESGQAVGKVAVETIPDDHVQVEITEGVPVARSWKFRVRDSQVIYRTDRFALKELPRKYNEKGLIIERKVPSLLHVSSRIHLPAGEHEFIVRSLDSARLYFDGELLAETPFMNLNGSAHLPYYHLPDFGPDLLSIPAGHSEKRVTVTTEEDGVHTISLYRLLGNKGKGDYLGELVVGIGKPGGPYRFLSPTREIALTDANWLDFLHEDEARLKEWEQRERLAGSEAEQKFWDERHEYTRAFADRLAPPLDSDISPAAHVDRLIAARLEEAGLRPMPLTDDFSFLRRVTLDTIGTVPTPEQIEEFFADPPETRRQLVIDRLLEHPAWADHWTGYWQDVLAENPGLTKPELNNSGPFRQFIYESFLDHKPIDRFVTELILMEGSSAYGGPAGFSIASQNDVPMAAKAHVIGTAFLGIEMKCARCHDAPYHDVLQEDLFKMAAMLKRGPQAVPKSSSIPATPEELENMVVKVTLPPGSSVKPDWPFVELAQSDSTAEVAAEPLPEKFLRNPSDSREQLAAQVTSPKNTRFARVIANRLWHRYLGRGIVEPIDDWEDADPSNPELLDFLAAELIRRDYDLREMARLILNSQAYQRIPASDPDAVRLTAGPAKRRLTGEQLADSLMQITGKDYGSEELTMDRDGKHHSSRFVHLRYPRRAWQFLAVSNERDRPSLNLPVAQSVIDLMSAFGWRQQRQDPLTEREDVLTPLQPMALANGTAPTRALDYSDYSALTELALEAGPVDQFVESLFLRVLSRAPTSDERQTFVEFLSEGYDDRIVAGPEAVKPQRIFRSGITWSTHFAPEADVEAMNREREIQEGDPPSVRLHPDWRARAEDATWALVNTPEFVFVP